MVKFLLLAVCVAITVWLSLTYIGRLIRGFAIPKQLAIVYSVFLGHCKRITTMNKTIHDFIRRFTHSREWCHEEMQNRGSVGPDGCPGLVGGDRETDFLQYKCIGCPYIDPKAYCTHPASSK